MEAGTNIVGIQFKRAGKIYDFSYRDINLRMGDKVLVETEWGEGVGKVAKVAFLRPEEIGERKLKPILRKLSRKEIHKSFHLTSSEVTSFVKRKANRFKLNMKVLKTDILCGGGRILVFFSAPGRVDFRELVKELAAGLKTRVELKQIGARDETKLLGGVGICGREFCCSSFLREFIPVSIKMAKNQNLALNPSKVSGGCGRLLCCLAYENEGYKKLRTKFPPLGSEIRIKETGQTGTLTKSDILNQAVQVRFKDSMTPEVFKLDDIELIPRKKKEEPKPPKNNQ